MIINNTLAIASQVYYNIITFCNYIVLFVGGSVQMKKLPSLNLEVIRFTTEDVIVTSGIVKPTYDYHFAANANSTYVSSGSELYQGGYTDCSEEDWYSFKYDSTNTSFKTIIPWQFNPDSRFYYAWFKETKNTWFTEHFYLKKYTNTNMDYPTN